MRSHPYLQWQTYLNYLFSRKRNRHEEPGLNIARDMHTGIPDAFGKLSEATGTKGQYGWRSHDIARLLGESRPQHIVELGAGRSTLLFAAYAKRAGIRFTTFEQNEQWRGLIQSTLEELGLTAEIVFSPVTPNGHGARYQMDIPASADFIYLDGPYISREERFPTFTGKPAYSDVADFLNTGARPRVIVVDGRTDSVDLILAQPAARDYIFAGEFAWAIQRSKPIVALALQRHSIFRRRP